MRTTPTLLAQGEPLGGRLSVFIIKHVGIMDMTCIAQQVSDYLTIQEPTASGIDQPTVYEHIARHMLHPKVRLAVTLRQLLDFLSLLQTSLVINEDGGACAVDKGNAELYLKVIAQVLTLYKVDTTGMLFTEEEKGGGPRGGGGGGGAAAALSAAGGVP
jgi:hypothetical protein